MGRMFLALCVIFSLALAGGCSRAPAVRVNTDPFPIEDETSASEEKPAAAAPVAKAPADPAAKPPVQSAPQKEAYVLKSQPVSIAEPDIDRDPRIAYHYSQDMRFGLTVLMDANGRSVHKQLTYANDGQTNDTMVRIAGEDYHFGMPGGTWGEKNAKFGNGSRSVWTTNRIQITQIVEIVPGKQPIDVSANVRKRLLDTCLVRYELLNRDNRERPVAVRMMVDTLIGMNDGVPFAVPNMKGLVDTYKEFATPDEVPDFVQALEHPNFQSPGTVGHMTLKVGNGIEAPSRVRLTHWTPFPLWDIPTVPMDQDSAVVLYWANRMLKPGDTRVVGFSYGLGQLAGNEGTGKLAISVNGAFAPGTTFTVTAYLKKPAAKDTVTLDLPASLQLVNGKNTEPVPPLAGAAASDTSTVTWSVKADKVGRFQIRVRSSTGVAQAKVVTISGE